MNTGGLIAQAFKMFMGNPDIMAILITFTVFITLLLSIVEIFNKTKT